MKYQFVYLNVNTVRLNELASVCLNGRAGPGKPSRRYSKIPVRIFKSPYIYINVVTVVIGTINHSYWS